MTDASVDASEMFPIEDGDEAYLKAEEQVFDAIRQFGLMLHERNMVLADALARISSAETIEDAVAIAADALAEFGIAGPAEEGSAGKGGEPA